MEEKEVAMSGQQNPDNEKQEKKLSYEELLNVASQLNQQCQALARQNDELRYQLGRVNDTETRLHYLFKVLENRNAFGDPDYIITVCDEIKDILTIKQVEQDKEKQSEE